MHTKLKKTILFITHKESQCGIYEFWKNIAEILKTSTKYTFIKVECWSMKDLFDSIKQYNPSAIIYNYHPAVMPWLTNTHLPHILYENNIFQINIPQIWIIHEVTQKVINHASNKKKQYILLLQRQFINKLFDYYIAPDPTLILNNTNVFKTGRLIPEYHNIYPTPDIPTIGSFWFGTWNKWFEEIVKHVQEEFDEAIIRFNIPFAQFWDPLWENAKTIAENCKSLIKKEKIKLTITHDFFKKQEMLDFLAKNTINIFLYQNPKWESRWISSVIENALAVQRPICISKSSMFRHIADTKPSICIEDNSIKNIIKNWFLPLEKYHKVWGWKGLTYEYEKIIDSII